MSTRRLVVPAQATAAPSVGSIPRSRMTEIEQAVVVTMAYADLFDYPPTREELHRYLVGTAAAPAEVDAAIARLIGRHLEQRDDYLCINGREEIFEIRTRRHRASPPRWTAARRYARALSRWPFVRMVAVCGSLAMDNVDEDGDIDVFCITAPGRLWWGQAAAMLLRRWPGFARQRVCPNYFLSQESLLLEDRDL